MKLRFPTLAEVLGLFRQDTSVSSAIAGLTRARQRLEQVIAYQQRIAKERADEQREHLARADAAATLQTNALNEAATAQRIAGRLGDLTA